MSVLKYPEAIKDFMLSLVAETRLPAYLLVNDDETLVESGGELRLYGLDQLVIGGLASEYVPFLTGMLPLDTSPVSLPYVKLESGLTSDIYLFKADGGQTFVLLLDATWDAKKRRAIQQKANELSLTLFERQQAEEELQQEKDALESLVQERTLDLARANQALKRELDQRTAIESALRASEARFRRVFESNMIGIMFWDLSGVVTEANDAFLEMIGYTREDLRAGHIRWENITRPDLRHLDDQAISEMRATGKSKPFAKSFIRKDGALISLLFGAALLEGSQNQTVCFAINLDGRG
jgi:PAS domain S-box-containing protein